MFEEGFPVYLSTALHHVLENMSKATYNNISIGYTNESNNEQFELLDGSMIQFPYRIYFVDDDELYHRLSAQEERLIYHCIFTRSCDGHIREKHLRAILDVDYPEWCMPYILKLSAEYVVEILDIIYVSLKDKDNLLFQAFCQNNPYIFRYYHNRMISYWNEFYREQCYRYHDYVGYKLYKECLGYTRRNDRDGISLSTS